MAQLFKDVRIDWLGKRRYFIGLSILLLLAGMGTAVYRHKFHPNGTEAFNLGVDFKGGTVITARFKQPPSVETLRAAIDKPVFMTRSSNKSPASPANFSSEWQSRARIPHQLKIRPEWIRRVRRSSRR